MKLFTHSLNRTSIICLAASSVLLLILWHVSTPSTSGPLGILIIFTLIYIFFTALILFITGLWSLFVTNILGRAALNSRRRYYVSSVLGFLPVLYLTLLSMAGASIWGIVLIALFIGLMLFYVLRRSA
jgi:hypothetical protein